jgi:hypothetical protein
VRARTFHANNKTGLKNVARLTPLWVEQVKVDETPKLRDKIKELQARCKSLETNNDMVFVCLSVCLSACVFVCVFVCVFACMLAGASSSTTFLSLLCASLRSAGLHICPKRWMEDESCVCYANHLTPDLISLHPSFLLVSQLLLRETEKGSCLLEHRDSTVSKRAFKRMPQLTETLLDEWGKVQIDDLVSELESVRTANYQLEAKIAQLEAKNKQLEDVSGSKFFCAPGPAVQGKSVLASSVPYEGVLASSVPVAPLGWSPRSFPPSSLARCCCCRLQALLARQPVLPVALFAPSTAHERASSPTPLPDAASTRALPAASPAAKGSCCCLPPQPRILSCCL